MAKIYNVSMTRKQAEKEQEQRRKRQIYQHDFYKSHRERWDEYNLQRKSRYENDPGFREKRLKQRRDNYDKRRITVLRVYSNGTLSCAVCGFNDTKALTIDHIKEIGRKRGEFGGSNLVKYLFDNNFPPGFQVLCANCNAIKEFDRRRANGIKV